MFDKRCVVVTMSSLCEGVRGQLGLGHSQTFVPRTANHSALPSLPDSSLEPPPEHARWDCRLPTYECYSLYLLDRPIYHSVAVSTPFAVKTFTLSVILMERFKTLAHHLWHEQRGSSRDFCKGQLSVTLHFLPPLSPCRLLPTTNCPLNPDRDAGRGLWAPAGANTFRHYFEPVMSVWWQWFGCFLCEAKCRNSSESSLYILRGGGRQTPLVHLSLGLLIII